MRFRILGCALVWIPVFIVSCSSSEPTGNEGDSGSLVFDGDFNGVANGTLTVGGKAFPIEFIASAYSKRVTLTGFTDLAHQDTGWHVVLSASAATTAPQDIGKGSNLATLAYRPKLDSVQCLYNGKVGTVTLESFAAKTSGATHFFRSSGKASFSGNKNTNYSEGQCPTLSFELTFSQVDTQDGGLNQ